MFFNTFMNKKGELLRIRNFRHDFFFNLDHCASVKANEWSWTPFNEKVMTTMGTTLSLMGSVDPIRTQIGMLFFLRSIRSIASSAQFKRCLFLTLFFWCIPLGQGNALRPSVRSFVYLYNESLSPISHPIKHLLQHWNCRAEEVYRKQEETRKLHFIQIVFG